MKARTIQIEAIGDYAAHKIKPRIRICGYWLDRAGFTPGQRVAVRLTRPGELTLQLQALQPSHSAEEGFQPQMATDETQIA